MSYVDDADRDEGVAEDEIATFLHELTDLSEARCRGMALALLEIGREYGEPL